MKKKLSLFVLSLVFLVIMIIGFVKMNVYAATCTPTTGTACTGECCKLMKDGCVAGPCLKIL
jgi:hypothetical protein